MSKGIMSKGIMSKGKLRVCLVFVLTLIISISFFSVPTVANVDEFAIEVINDVDANGYLTELEDGFVEVVESIENQTEALEDGFVKDVEPFGNQARGLEDVFVGYIDGADYIDFGITYAGPAVIGVEIVSKTNILVPTSDGLGFKIESKENAVLSFYNLSLIGGATKRVYIPRGWASVTFTANCYLIGGSLGNPCKGTIFPTH